MKTQNLVIAALAAAIVMPCWALSTDRNQSIEVSADRFDGDEVKQTAVYTGAVVVNQGSMQITGERLELRVTPKGYRQATVTGKPSKFRQQQDPKAKNPVDEWVNAQATRIVYDEETDTITLEGGARLARTENGRERDTMQGERIVYDMRNARSTVEGAKTSTGGRQRVTTVIAPRNETAPARPSATLSPADKLTAPKN